MPRRLHDLNTFRKKFIYPKARLLPDSQDSCRVQASTILKEKLLEIYQAAEERKFIECQALAFNLMKLAREVYDPRLFYYVHKLLAVCLLYLEYPKQAKVLAGAAKDVSEDHH